MYVTYVINEAGKITDPTKKAAIIAALKVQLGLLSCHLVASHPYVDRAAEANSTLSFINIATRAECNNKYRNNFIFYPIDHAVIAQPDSVESCPLRSKRFHSMLGEGIDGDFFEDFFDGVLDLARCSIDLFAATFGDLDFINMPGSHVTTSSLSISACDNRIMAISSIVGRSSLSAITNSINRSKVRRSCTGMWRASSCSLFIGMLILSALPINPSKSNSIQPLHQFNYINNFKICKIPKDAKGRRRTPPAL